MKFVIIICSLLLLSFLLFRNSFPKFFEGLSILLFRLGFYYMVYIYWWGQWVMQYR